MALSNTQESKMAEVRTYEEISSSQLRDSG